VRSKETEVKNSSRKSISMEHRAWSKRQKRITKARELKLYVISYWLLGKAESKEHRAWRKNKTKSTK
jgi:hypothetical protein